MKRLPEDKMGKTVKIIVNKMGIDENGNKPYSQV